tara:strand:- start:11880 stop:12653 length:774 start_codon:yes stop_codon:yes gene_type:complete
METPEHDSGLGPSAERPTLVLLPGMDGTGDLFGPLLDVIGDACSAIVVRYPVDQVLNYEQLTRRVLEQLPDDRPFVVVAESFSGPIAIRLAALQPRGLIGVVLSATFARNPTGVSMRLVRVLAGPLVRIRPPRWFVRWRLLRRSDPQDLVDLAMTTIHRVDPKVFAHRLVEVASVDVRRERAATKVPILWMHAKRERLLQVRRWSLQDGAFGMERVVVLDGPHLLLQSCPTEAWGHIEEFVATCTAASERAVETTDS